MHAKRTKCLAIIFRPRSTIRQLKKRITEIFQYFFENNRFFFRLSNLKY